MTNNGHSSDEAIRIEAYLLSEKAGHPRGREQTFWKQAEAIVHSRLTSKITKEKPAAKSKPFPVKGASSAKAQPLKKPVAAKVPKKAKVNAIQEPLEPPVAPPTVTVKKAPGVKKTNPAAAKANGASASKPPVPAKGKANKPSRK